MTARRKSAWLWGVSLLFMLAAASYQHRTGPTYPRKGTFSSGGEEFSYALPRSAANDAGARVEIPSAHGTLQGMLRWRRLGLDEPFKGAPMQADGDLLVAELPAQPPAGKLEYFVSTKQFRIPKDPKDFVVIRFKGPVPLWALIPHVTLMFLSMLFGVRTALAAIFFPRQLRRLAWITLGGLTAGGMILGPIVQKYAFGALWTGVPFGYDLTDNKTLVMWAVWLCACLVIGRRARRNPRLGRIAAVLATAVMIAVYLVPHSLRGSQLDYKQLERGVSPTDAVRTG